MYYLTNNNYRKLLYALSIDIPFNDADSYIFYYSQYHLSEFELDLQFFTKDEAKALVISDMIYKDISFMSTNVLIKKIRNAQSQWVEKLGMPSYHCDKGCSLIIQDFNNFRMPESCNITRHDEYREFFESNRHKYGYSEKLREPKIFCRILKQIFDLTESIDELELNHFRKTTFDNSEIAEFNATLNFDLEMNRIQSLIDIFKLNLNNLEVTPRMSRQSWLANDKSNKFFDEKREIMCKIYSDRKEIIVRIINFHFQHLFHQGADIPEHILKLIGFQPCKKCCTKGVR